MSKTALALSPRQTVPKKYPRRLWCSPLQAMPAHNKTVCTDSKGNQAGKTSSAEAFPLPPICYALPVLLFLESCIARTGRKNNRIHNKEKTQQRKNRIKAKESKQTAKPKRQRKQAKRESVTHSNAITKQASKKRNRQHKQESLQACLLLQYKQERSRPYKYYSPISIQKDKQERKEKLYYSPLCLYNRIAYIL